MRTKLLTGLLVFMLTSLAPAFAASAGTSPLMGNWAVDISRLPIPPEARPKSVNIVFRKSGKDSLTIMVDIVDGAGKLSHATSTATLDGKPTEVSGGSEADVAAAMMPTANVLVLVLGKNGVGGSTRVYTLAADGKTMIETATYYTQDGQPLFRTNYFTRSK
ncbi:MAG TPA: hypothetical protein VMI92_06745 [Steroidobacteraceae bacterium]|nr:hypothetical protein [Steroidobacteraceae bacterium]